MVCSAEDWTVVGAGGKPRRRGSSTHPQQQQQGRVGEPAAAAAAAAARSPAQPASASDLGGLVPGWQVPSCAPQHRKPQPSRAKGRRDGSQLGTAEDRLSHAAAQLDALVQELAAAPVFQALLHALSSTAPGAAAAPRPDPAAGGDAGDPPTAPAAPPPTPPAAAAAAAAAEAARGSSGAAWPWSTTQHLVVYGLGSPEHSRVSRYQLAMVRLLQSLLPGLADPPQLYDPVFTDFDNKLLQRLGMQVIGTDEQGAHAVDSPTLFFLPHCEAALCERLMAANWCPRRLPLVTVLGNSFSTYEDRWALSPASKPGRPHRMLALVAQGLVCERRVSDHGFHVASAFNDMALHTFPGDPLAQALPALPAPT